MRIPRALAALAVLSVAACTTLPPGAPAELWERAWPEIRWTYDRLALERGGICTQPRIEAVTRVEEVERRSGRVVLRLSYRFRDDSYEDDGWGFTGVLRRCEGFAERTFTVDARTGRVLAMDGPQRTPRDFSPR